MTSTAGSAPDVGDRLRCRRVVVIGLTGATAAILLTGCLTRDDAGQPATIYPIDGSRGANVETTISFRGAGADDLDDLEVTGSASGRHQGDLVAHRDGEGATFRPDEPFEAGEEILVVTDAEVVGDGDIGFAVAVPADPPAELSAGAPSELPDPATVEFATMPDVRVPRATVEGDVGSEMFLATPRPLGDSTPGAAILDPAGDLVWWHPAPDDEITIGNLSAHTIDGEPVLAWFEGTAPFGIGKYVGEWVIVDSTYAEVGRIAGANGIPADIHDLVLTDDGTALVVAYQPVVMDLTDDGGSGEATVLDSVVQEIDLETGDVYFEWHSVDAVPIAHTRIDDLAGDVVDYAHINSVDLGSNGNVVVSLRHTSQVMEVDRSTGEPVWVLGGDANTVDVGDDIGISFPHHARWLSDGTLSVFDNGVEHDDPTSRGVIYEFSSDRDSAEVVADYTADPPAYTATQGSIQVGDDGALAMWSTTGRATRFDVAANPTGTIDLGTGSYRLFTTDWVGRPAQRPVAVLDGDRILVSWNGATEVERWEVLRDDEGLDSQVADGFETAIELSSEAAGVDGLQVRALDATGDVIVGSTTGVDPG